MRDAHADATQASVAAKLLVLRAERGLTLRDVGRMTGLDKYTLSKIERGKQRPHTLTLAKIAKGFGIPLGDLMPAQALSDEAEASKETEPLLNKHRDPNALQRALLIILREGRKAWHRNGHKKDPRREQPAFWLDKLKEEAEEVEEAWMSGNKQRLFEEMGDVVVSLAGIILQGGYDLMSASREERKKEEA